MATSVTSAMSIPMLEKRSVCRANCCPGGSTAERWGKSSLPAQGRLPILGLLGVRSRPMSSGTGWEPARTPDSFAILLP